MSDRIAYDGVTVNAPDALAPATSHADLVDGVATGDAHRAVSTGAG